MPHISASSRDVCAINVPPRSHYNVYQSYFDLSIFLFAISIIRPGRVTYQGGLGLAGVNRDLASNFQAG